MYVYIYIYIYIYKQSYGPSTAMQATGVNFAGACKASDGPCGELVLDRNS